MDVADAAAALLRDLRPHLRPRPHAPRPRDHHLPPQRQRPAPDDHAQAARSLGRRPEHGDQGDPPRLLPDAGGYVDTPRYDRAKLAAGAVFHGPAIVEDVDSTAVIGPNTRVEIDGYANLIATLLDA
jgi:hypothetical protein